MNIRRFFLGLLGCALCAAGYAWAFSSVIAIPDVPTLTSGDFSSSTYAYVNLAGYHVASDGGGGPLTQISGCAISTTASTIANNSPTITVGSTTGIIPGMTIYAYNTTPNPIPAGDVITQVNATTGVITLASNTINSASTTTTLILGGNGGTLFMDYQPSTMTPVCFQRQDYSGDVRQFGARCDVVISATDGSIASGSTSFSSSLVSFTSADVGKVLELNYAKSVEPFMSTIVSVSGGIATLNTAAPAAFPNDANATDANMNLPPDGNDTPGYGFQPGDVGTDAGNLTSGTQVTVKRTGLVNFLSTSNGANYVPGDILYGMGTGGSGGSTTKQFAPAQLQILSVNSTTGGVSTWAIIDSGLWGNVDPTSMTWTGGHGSGFVTTLLGTNAVNSFGVADVAIAAKGSYGAGSLPANPVSMHANSGSGTGWSVDLAFSTADWSYGTNDTFYLQNIESYAETYPTSMRGLAGAIKVPPGMCYASGLVLNRPVSWSGAGAKQSRLVQILGSSGTSVNGSTPGFFTLAIAYPLTDDYEQSNYGQPQPTFQNMAFWGTSPETAAYVDSTSTSTNASAGIVLANPVTNRGKAVPFYLSNVEIQRFPNDLLFAYNWGGDLRGYQINLFNSGATVSSITGNTYMNSTNVDNLNSTVGLFPGMSIAGGGIPTYDTITAVSPGSNSVTLAVAATANNTGESLTFTSGNCLDIERLANPTHFYGLVTAHCNYGIHIDHGAQYEFHGWVGYSNNINLVVTGAPKPGSTLTFYGAQFTSPQNQSMYLDQQNEAVICYMCKFKQSNNSNGTGDSDADIVIGPDAGSGSAGNLYPVLQLSAPQFGTEGQDSSFENILFDANSGNYCTCRVTLDGLSVDRDNQSMGVPLTNLLTQVLSGNLYAPFQLVTGSGTAVVASAPAAASYNWNFPLTAGMTRQDLGSNGGGANAMTWGASSRQVDAVTSSSGATLTAAGNISPAYAIWEVDRVGPTAAFTDTWDSAGAIQTAIGTGLATVGQVFNAVICNATAYTETLAAGTGDTLTGPTTVSGGTCRRFGIDITGTGGTKTVTIVGG